MKKMSLLFIGLFILLQFNGCDSSVNSDTDINTGASIAGSLDSNNVGIAETVTSDNIDTVLKQLFALCKPGNGLDIFYTRNLRDTTIGDTTITIDTTCNGLIGYILCSGTGQFDYEIIESEEKYLKKQNSEVSVTETFYNYSQDSSFYIGGEVISTEIEYETIHESDVVAFWTQEKNEICSLYIAFNGAYEGALKGTMTQYMKENSDMVLDSSRTASFTLTSGGNTFDVDDISEYMK